MDDVFVIGLPNNMRGKIEGRAKRAGRPISAVWATIGKEGSPVLLPHPRGAIHSLRAYYDRAEVAQVLVLQYAEVPDEVLQEVTAIAELGGITRVVEPGEAGWPQLKQGQKFDGTFTTALYLAVESELFDQEERASPAEYLHQLAERSSQLLIPDGALDSCDEVAPHRHSFIHRAGDALLHLCQTHGDVGPIAAFFDARGLGYAHTGGITTTLEVYKDGKRIHHEDSNIHLKKGDKTTPQAAVRIYYQALVVEGTYYVAVLYAGPHTDVDVTRRHVLR